MCGDADCETRNKESGEGERDCGGWRGGGVDGVMICRKVRENSNFGPNFSPPLDTLVILANQSLLKKSRSLGRPGTRGMASIVVHLTTR